MIVRIQNSFTPSQCIVASSIIQMEIALRGKEVGTSSNTVASFLFIKHDFENEDPTGGSERFDHIFVQFFLDQFLVSDVQ